LSLRNLKQALKEVKNTEGIDKKNLDDIKDKDLLDVYEKIIKEEYIPEPVKKIDFEKNGKIRPISLSSIIDKIIQKVLSTYLYTLYNSEFSDKSYAYRPNKSTLKAINRVSDFIRRRNEYVIKSDIKDFFETIDHGILISILKRRIKDKRIINLLLLYLKTGFYDVKNEYYYHNIGVYQGNIISPILSNIYLNEMDCFLEKHGMDFVRFADDFVIFTKTKFKAEWILRNLKRFLKLYKLSLKDEKTYITTINSGFTFLGAFFRNDFRTIDKKRLEKIDAKLMSYTKEEFDVFVKKMNFYYSVIENYYLKIIPKTSSEYKTLKNMVIGVVSEAVYLNKLHKKINKKTEFKELILNIKFLDLFFNRKKTVDLIISKAYNRLDSAEKKIEKKRRIYDKKFALENVIHIYKSGMSLGISKNRFVLKEKGKIIKYFPKNVIKRIIVESMNMSLSTNIIKEASKLNINIDFIHKRTPYASINFYNSAAVHAIHKQAMILNTDKHIKIARSIVVGKIKNERNYLRYLNKYYKRFEKALEMLKGIEEKAKNSSNIESLRGYEGSAAAVYWKNVGIVADVENFERVTKGAKDLINSSLNYAYAILYGKVQHSLLLAGLSLHISYLHALDEYKPTLVFDLIEEFRTYVVERAVFSMFSKHEKLEIKEGLLTVDTKKKIANEIYERLATYTKYKNKNMKMENIILSQAYELKKAIVEDKKYKPFIGRY